MPSDLRVAMLADLEAREAPPAAKLRFPTWLIVERHGTAGTILRISTTGISASPEDDKAPERLEPLETLLARRMPCGGERARQICYELLQVPTWNMPFPGHFVPARGAARLTSGAPLSLRVTMEPQGTGEMVEAKLVLLADARPWVDEILGVAV